MTDLNLLARRLEGAQAQLNERLNHAAGGQSLAVGGGFAHFRGPAHPLNQALGLINPISEPELEAVERFLGAPTVLELSPGADAALWPLLARRGYRVQQFQQLWVRKLDGFSAAGELISVRIARPEEADQYNRITGAGFMEQSDWREFEPPFSISLSAPGAFGFIVSVEGEPAGGGLLGMVDGVAVLAGDSVLPKFRGRALQRKLIEARLRTALELGCDVACAGTAPSTASQRSYEACGFRAAYPKLELARGQA
jgi:GNAT superfamily N-acetyltransferase